MNTSRRAATYPVTHSDEPAHLNTRRRAFRRGAAALQAAWLLGLAVYILAGIGHVPFHGDESTQIYMSRDYDYLVRDRDLSLVRYHQPPLNATEQQLRLLNGVVHKYLVGFARQIAGIASTNEQWDWATTWEVNWASGHAPDAALLRLGRWTSALFLAAGAGILYGVARDLGGIPAALIASLVYTLHPALLLNGRRAMQEGSMIFFALLTLWAGIALLRHGGRWRVAALGFAAGLAVASKHTNAFGAAGVFVSLFAVQAVTYTAARVRERTAPPSDPRPHVAFVHGCARIGAAGVLALLLFFLLNPAWWGDPIARAQTVLSERTALLDFQVLIFGGYADGAAQWRGFVHQVLSAPPQYYEVADWAGYIGEAITRYEHSGLAGLHVGESLAGVGLLLVALGAGLIDLARAPAASAPVRGLVGGWAALVCLSALLLTPLEWQRYYLPVYPVIALLAGLGGAALFRRLRIRRPAPVE